MTTYNDQGLCHTCLNSIYSFDVAWSACLYEDPLPNLIHAFKYQGKTLLRKSFSHLLIDFIDMYKIPLNHFDMIVPVPLHSTRYRERGFNQAQLLSQEIARHYNLIHRNDIIIRSKSTLSQTTQEAKQRWTNVSDAFRINHSLDIADKNILIVDDLLTTAATANAISNALKDAGAAYVGVLTLAITP